jgi:hypothetical protein
MLKKTSVTQQIVSTEVVERRILVLRGHRVMLDRDLDRALPGEAHRAPPGGQTKQQPFSI